LLRERQEKTYEEDYEKKRNRQEEDNIETLLDICRDVTLNERLKAVCKGQELLERREFYSK
jgi:hypothetical protein